MRLAFLVLSGEGREMHRSGETDCKRDTEASMRVFSESCADLSLNP